MHGCRCWLIVANSLGYIGVCVCMGKCAHGCMGIQYVCMGVWVYVCMGVWVYVCMGVCVYECMGVCVCMGIWVHGCMCV